jgi:hypothetical protein
MCPVLEIADIENSAGKQRRRSFGAGTAAKKCDCSSRLADAETQSSGSGRGNGNQGGGKIGKRLRAAAFPHGKKAGKIVEIFHAKKIQQALAGEDQPVWLRRMSPAHRNNWHMGG